MADIFEEKKIFLANSTYCGLRRLPATRRDNTYESYKENIYRTLDASHHGISGAYETIVVTLLLSHMFQCIMVTSEE